MDYLNLGCGDYYHPDWTNVDIISTGEGVIAHDLTQGIPFPDASNVIPPLGELIAQKAQSLGSLADTISLSLA
jgi:hypothetical protein